MMNGANSGIAANRSIGTLGTPDSEVSVRDVFGLKSDLVVPAFSEAADHVPEIDPTYQFDHDTTLAISSARTPSSSRTGSRSRSSGKASCPGRCSTPVRWSSTNTTPAAPT
jgi:cobaltochelatase CobS